LKVSTFEVNEEFGNLNQHTILKEDECEDESQLEMSCHAAMLGRSRIGTETSIENPTW